LLVAGGFAHAQPPAIFQGAVVNHASGMHPTLAGGAIARGALFTIRGLRFGPDPAAISLRISQGSAMVTTRILKLTNLTLNSQLIQARMPADAPLGAVELAVLRGDEPSRPFRLRVAASSFGIYSDGTLDWSPGRIYAETRGKRRPVTYLQPARYGERLIVTGTGLGDETHPEVVVGGVSAAVLGVESKAGVDEIAFSVPRETPAGCSVPLHVMVHKQVVSNFVSMALAAEPGACKETHGWPSPVATPGQRGAVVLVSQVRSELLLKNGARDETTSDDATAAFLRAGVKEKYVVPLHALPPLGTCVAYARPAEGRVALSGQITMPILTAMTGGFLNAGRELRIDGPKGPRRIFPDPKAAGYYGIDLGGAKPGSSIERPLYLESGEVRISGEGGPEVGPFSVSLNAGSRFEWVNRAQTRVVERASGLKFEWKGLDPGRLMGVIAVNVDEETAAMGLSFCLARPGASSISIPPALLANLPASQNIPGIPYDFVALVSLPERPTSFSARGLDAAYGLYVYIDGKSVEFR
jgi:uncharacterized protein (TIGR03437 family)